MISICIHVPLTTVNAYKAIAALRELKCTRLACIKAQRAIITLIKIIQLSLHRLICGFRHISAKQLPGAIESFLVVDERH